MRGDWHSRKEVPQEADFPILLVKPVWKLSVDSRAINELTPFIIHNAEEFQNENRSS